ncbi:hypothetical protein [Vibrio phage RYC]|nr:hypothetical protein [Vibrio phage RYC]
MANFYWKENWDRSYRITIGVREATELPEEIEAEVKAAGILARPVLDSDYTTTASNARIISNLVSDGYDPRGFTFTFDTNQVASKTGSKGENSFLELYNINKDLADVLTQEKCIVQIECGYDQQVAMTYSGDVIHVTMSRSGADIIHRVKLGAMALPSRDEQMSVHYDETLSDRDIIIDMVGRFSGIALGTYGLEEPSNHYRTGGNTFVGKLVTNYDKMMAKYNLQYAVINGKMVIIPYRFRGNDWDIFYNTNYNLPEDSIKSITPVFDTKSGSSNAPQTKNKKLQISTFFLPIEIGQMVTIPSSSEEVIGQYAGTYIVKGRRIVLNSTSGSWDTTVTVEEV